MTERNKKRRSRKSLLAAAVIAIAVWMGWCGRGYFLGSGSSGTDAADRDPSAAAARDAAPARCRIRVDANGVQLGGARVTVGKAVEACKASGEADLTGLRQLLLDSGYDGWCTVEQDRDPAGETPPLDDARANRDYLRSIGFD